MNTQHSPLPKPCRGLQYPGHIRIEPLFRDEMPKSITIRGIKVDLEWYPQADGNDAVGEAVHTVTPSQMEVGQGPVDGETFEIDGDEFELGSHDYSTDQPGNENDENCTCSAKIYRAK